MPDPPLTTLHTAYGALRDIVLGLDESTSWCPTRCAGWTVRDLVQHLLSDSQRALVALGTPAHRPADKDALTYWVDAPGAPDADSRGIRATRTMASQWRLDYLTGAYAETTRAVEVLAGRGADDELVETQGHVLRVADLVRTLTVEAAIHHLDLVVDLERPGPGPGPLAEVRTTLDGLLGRPTPQEWPDCEWALVATGRAPVLAQHRAVLGPDVDRLPLLR